MKRKLQPVYRPSNNINELQSIFFFFLVCVTVEKLIKEGRGEGIRTKKKLTFKNFKTLKHT